MGGIGLPGFCCLWYPQVSSRAPVWGASWFGIIGILKALSFKSCPRVGGILSRNRWIWIANVSSRAPVWGASSRHPKFNIISKRFQVVPPCGGHPVKSIIAVTSCGFKSCPRVGGIPGGGGPHGPWPVSSRAPVWGASSYDQRQMRKVFVSSRAPVWGASRTLQFLPYDITCFKSCPRVGGIAYSCDIQPCSGGFKSCPRVGGILQLRQRLSKKSQSFKSCPRVGGIGFRTRADYCFSAFQVVPPCGGHPAGAVHRRPTKIVSSRAPVWGASLRGQQLFRLALFQVVPPCGGHRARK